MQLRFPDDIGVSISETTNALIQDVEETARRVHEHRPLPKAVLSRIDDELLGERVYSSNAIEGSTLDLRETILVLKHGAAGAQKKREATEAENLGEAVKHITRYQDEGQKVHETDKLLRVHGLILRGINDDWAGRFREHSVMIRGATIQPPDHSYVPSLVDAVMAYLRKPRESNAVLRGTWVHWALARIHPFHDGNGRLARLWGDLVLLEGKLTCAIIRPEDRRNYLEALTHADDGDFNPLVQLVAQRVSATFDTYLIHLGMDAEFKEWVVEVAGEVDARSEERSRLTYQRWSRKMEQLRREFELCAAKVSETSQTVRIQVLRYPPIEQTKWENIRSGIGAQKTWHFALEFSSQVRRRRYFFFFGKHFWSDLDNERERSEQRVSLLIGEDDGSGKHSVQLDEIDGCPLTIREVFVVDNELVVRCLNPDVQRAEYQRDVSALRIAQDFIREVLYHRLV
jgi:Fic family protein